MSASNTRPLLILIAMTGTLAMVFVDQTIVTVALPTMMKELPLSPAGAHWVVSAYLLAMAALVALGGRLGDWLGATTIVQLGVAIFFLASCGCGLVPDGAWGEPLLLLFRALQGVGAALMMPASQAVVADTYPVETRGRAMAIYAGVGQVFLALGPLLGGFLTEAVSWRAVFWLNLPVGLATLVLIRIAKPGNARADARAPSAPVAATLVIGMALFVLGIQEGPGFGWGSPVTVGSIVIGLAILGWLMRQQWRAADPLIDIRQVALPGIAGDLVVLTLVQFALLGLVLYGTFYLQNIMGAAPLTAGFMSLPLILGIAVGAQLGGWLYDTAGVRLPVLGGLLLGAVGTATWGFSLLGTDYWPQVPGMIVGGIGIGLVLSPASVDALSRADADKRSQISGLVQTVRQLGGTLGIAATGAVVLTLEPKGAVSAAARYPIAAAFAFSAAVLLLALIAGWFWLARDRLAAKADAGAAVG